MYKKYFVYHGVLRYSINLLLKGNGGATEQ